MQGLLLRTLLDDRGTSILCLLWTQFSWILLLLTQFNPWFAVALNIDLAIFAVRWRQRTAFRDATADELRRASPRFAAAIVASATLLSLAVYLLLVEGPTHTLVLGSVVAPGLAGFYASLYGGFPRLAILTFGMLDAALTVGLLQHPDWSVALLGLVMPFGGILYYFLIMRTRQSLVGSMRAQHDNWVRSMHDVLTGLGNRALLDAELTRACAGDTAFAVLTVDLDGFKPINDAYGHAAGDLVLKRTAGRFRAAVGAGDTICRTGGDEFTVLIRGADAIRTRRVAATLLAAVSAPIELATGPLVRVGASIGMATFPVDGHEPAALLERADGALYEAKREGKGRVAGSRG